MAITNKTILRLGNKEIENNKILQTVLKQKGYYKGVIDGSFGTMTKTAVMNYQKAKGLVQDGEAGPVTNKSLGILHAPPISNSTKTTVSYNSDKDVDLKAAASALGGKFNNVTGAYNLIKANEDYKKYFGDVKKWEEELKGNNNCVDWSQFLAHIMDKLNVVAKLGYKYRYVRAYCEISKIWHVYLEVTGGEFGSSKVDIDGAAAASDGSKYPISKAWCQNSKTKEYNPGYALKDDGI